MPHTRCQKVQHLSSSDFHAKNYILNLHRRTGILVFTPAPCSLIFVFCNKAHKGYTRNPTASREAVLDYEANDLRRRRINSSWFPTPCWPPTKLATLSCFTWLLGGEWSAGDLIPMTYRTIIQSDRASQMLSRLCNKKLVLTWSKQLMALSSHNVHKSATVYSTDFMRPSSCRGCFSTNIYCCAKHLNARFRLQPNGSSREVIWHISRVLLLPQGERQHTNSTVYTSTSSAKITELIQLLSPSVTRCQQGQTGCTRPKPDNFAFANQRVRVFFLSNI